MAFFDGNEKEDEVNQDKLSRESFENKEDRYEMSLELCRPSLERLRFAAVSVLPLPLIEPLIGGLLIRIEFSYFLNCICA